MPKLFVVPTPIGNLEDITLRAINCLTQVDFILAEDTRKTLFLLKHLKIEKRVYSYHKFNEHQQVQSILAQIKQGAQVALVSDAGTPGISDPGFLMIRHCVENDVEVECLPGATAFIPALVSSGLPCDRFVFEGFLPQKKGRKKRLELLKEEARTIVFYESPYRIDKLLEELIALFGPERQVSLGRELTKKFEEIIRGSLINVKNQFTEKKAKGEFVVVLAGK